MTHGRNLITTMLLAAAIILTSSRASDAQDQSPSPRMLLNLDLFTAPPSDKPSGPANAASPSTLEQLRALRAMGYLNADGPPPDDDDSAEASDTPKPIEQKSQGAQQ
jgi:hypothetical protein